MPAAGGRVAGGREAVVSDRGPGGHPRGLWPVPGEGVLARHGELILLSSIDQAQFADALLDLAEQAAGSGADGRQFTDAVADAIEVELVAHPQQAGSPGPSVLAFGPAGSGLAMVISGGAWAEVTSEHGTARLLAPHPGMLVRALIRSAITGVRGGLAPGDDDAVVQADRFSRLDGGLVRAAGLTYHAGGSRAGPGARASGQAGPGPARSPAPPEPEGALPGPEGALPEPEGAPAGPEGALAQPEGAPAGPEGALPGPEGALAQPEGAPAQPEGALPGPEGAPAQPEGAPAQPATEWAPTQAWSAPLDAAAPEEAASALPATDREPTIAPAPGRADPGQEPEAGPEPEPEDGPEPAVPFEAVLLGGPGAAPGTDLPPRPPLPLAADLPPGASSYVSQAPIVEGVYCENGHFDDPQARSCAVCGVSMNQQTLVPRPGPRPPLGVLVLDDGAVFQLDGDYVVGREPSLDGSVASGRCRPLRIVDESGIVSRVHARVHLEGWRVLVTDLGSANGTRVRLPGQEAGQPLAPQVPVMLTPGCVVDLGPRGFRYESHRGR